MDFSLNCKGDDYTQKFEFEYSEIHIEHQYLDDEYDGHQWVLTEYSYSDEQRHTLFSQINRLQIFYRFTLVVILHIILFVLLMLSWSVSERVIEMSAIQVVEQQSEYRAYVYQQPKPSNNDAELDKAITPELKPIKDQVSPVAEDKVMVEVVEVKAEPIEKKVLLDETQINQTAGNITPTKPVFDLHKATASFLQTRKLNKVTELSVKQRTAEHYGSASVMTPNMKPLILIKTDTLEKKLSLDNALDPNRIQRKGNICRRVVNIGDALNSNATMMGHPMKCGYSEQEKAFKKAISNRVDKFIKR